MMFNLESLNDYEFEMLCKDILEKKLGIVLYTFAKGKDGGIDICDAKYSPAIVGQAKHYYKSSFKQLQSSLRKETNRLYDKKGLKRYYVCTSQTLTKENKNLIYSMFSNYMDNTSSVIDAADINEFLSKDENAEILRKHYKLWLCASNVLSLITNQKVFIDCEELIDDIENSVKFFVETKSYNMAMKKLLENRIIVIIGNPGVGKSTLSKMLILRFVGEGYSIRYTTDNEIGNIKNALSLNPDKKEIILLDDFLGQHYLKIKDSQPNEIRSLISFVKRNVNKKLILNSRITILNEAKKRSIIFNELMENNDVYTYLIDLNEMTYIEKAKILYNHLYFNNITREYFDEIKKETRYIKIVYHKNYNPRIIEYVTNWRNYIKVYKENYFQYIMNKFDEPEDVWQDEFRNRLNEEDRILMIILYSLTDSLIAKDVLEKAFNNRIKNENLNFSLNVFKESYSRLSDSLLKSIDDKGIVKISVINPSVNDFLKSNLRSNTIEQIKIIKYSLYVEQIIKISKSDSTLTHVKEMVLNKDILQKSVLKYSIHYYYVKLAYDLKIYSEKIKSTIQKCFERMYENLNYSEREAYGKLLLSIINDKFVVYYDLLPILKNGEKIAFIVEPLSFEQLEIFLASLTERNYFSKEIIREISNTLRLEIKNKISIQAKLDTDDVLEKIVASEVDGYSEEEIENYKNGNISNIEDGVWDEIQGEMHDKIQKLIENVKEYVEISIEEFDLDFAESDFDIESAINAYFSESEVYDYDWYQDNSKTDFETIKEIFER